MQQSEIQDLLVQHFSGTSGFAPEHAQELSSALASVSSAVANIAGATANLQPTSKQSACYAKCEQTRNASLAAAARLGWPAGSIAAAAAVMQFNACRHSCDQSP
ncbi:MAG TPA: hypothetical protein VGN11_06800, partial [Candidatus Baltobacteraceae bacterium]|jgi:hypothetical protein|nr:hypothetical protein [Candidatus Baltobacteraceae bacterium]